MHPGTHATVLIEVANAAEERHLPTAANARIVWLHRNGTPAGTTPLLERALRAMAPPRGDLHAWLAGEIDIVRGLRTHLVEDRGIPRAQIQAAGYWRLGVADGHARLDD
jgi:NADPH-dependent ferric siderophore reductase